MPTSSNDTDTTIIVMRLRCDKDDIGTGFVKSLASNGAAGVRGEVDCLDRASLTSTWFQPDSRSVARMSVSEKPCLRVSLI